MARYGDPIAYGDQGLEYGRPPGHAPWEIELEPVMGMNILRASAIIDVPSTRPQVVLQPGIDFVIEHQPGKRSVLLTYHDIFDMPFYKEPIYDAQGVVVDQLIQLWLMEAELDPLAVFKNWGVLFGYDHQPSSLRYRDAVNALLDGIVAGGTEDTLLKFLQSVTGITLAQEEETIEAIYTNDKANVVITDKNVYTYPPQANVIKAVGDTLYRNDPITDGLLVYDIRQPQALPLLNGIYAGPGFVHGTTGLFFPNKDVPIIVEKDRDGRTHVRWELGGNPEAVERFWQDVRRRGIEQGRTLARYLDRRGPDAPTEPEAPHLPATINPAQFIASNLLRANTAVAIIGAQAEGTAASLLRLDLVRNILPPWTALLVVYQERSYDQVLPDDFASDGSGLHPHRMQGDSVSPTAPMVQEYATLSRAGEPLCQ
jgi:hypothetical protein